MDKITLDPAKKLTAARCYDKAGSILTEALGFPVRVTEAAGATHWEDRLYLNPKVLERHVTRLDDLRYVHLRDSSYRGLLVHAYALFRCKTPRDDVPANLAASVLSSLATREAIFTSLPELFYADLPIDDPAHFWVAFQTLDLAYCQRVLDWVAQRAGVPADLLTATYACYERLSHGARLFASRKSDVFPKPRGTHARSSDVRLFQKLLKSWLGHIQDADDVESGDDGSDSGEKPRAEQRAQELETVGQGPNRIQCVRTAEGSGHLQTFEIPWAESTHSIHHVPAFLQTTGTKPISADVIEQVAAELLSEAVPEMEVIVERPAPGLKILEEDLLYLSSGYFPAVWLQERALRSKPPWTLYVDVSESMTSHFPQLRYLLQVLKPYLGSAYQFSSQVVSVELEEVTRLVTTTGRTDIATALHHAVKNQAENVIIWTDDRDRRPGNLDWFADWFRTRRLVTLSTERMRTGPLAGMNRLGVGQFISLLGE